MRHVDGHRTIREIAASVARSGDSSRASLADVDVQGDGVSPPPALHHGQPAAGESRVDARHPHVKLPQLGRTAVRYLNGRNRRPVGRAAANSLRGTMAPGSVQPAARSVLAQPRVRASPEGEARTGLSTQTNRQLGRLAKLEVALMLGEKTLLPVASFSKIQVVFEDSGKVNSSLNIRVRPRAEHCRNGGDQRKYRSQDRLWENLPRTFFNSASLTVTYVVP